MKYIFRLFLVACLSGFFFSAFGLVVIDSASASAKHTWLHKNECKKSSLRKLKDSNKKICIESSGKYKYVSTITPDDAYRVSAFCLEQMSRENMNGTEFCRWIEDWGLFYSKKFYPSEICVSFLRQSVYESLKISSSKRAFTQLELDTWFKINSRKSGCTP
jgi:hypothetical protein